MACLDQVLAGGLVAEIVGEGDEALPLARAHHVAAGEEEADGETLGVVSLQKSLKRRLPKITRCFTVTEKAMRRPL